MTKKQDNTNGAGGAPRTGQAATGWGHLTLPAEDGLTADALFAALQGDVSGLRLPGVYDEGAMKALTRAVLDGAQGVQYVGLDLGSVLGVRSHWDMRYTVGEEGWGEYFAQMDAAERTRQALFADLGDPMDLVEAMLRRAWPGEVKRMRHPRNGREMFAGLLRTGTPELHFDWAPYDLQERDVVGQLGFNLYLFNPGPGGDLRVFRTLGVQPGNTADSGVEPVGNYGLSYALVDGVESDVVPCRTGDFVLAPNRYLHDVTPCTYDGERLALSAHVAWMRDGSLRLFS